MNCKFCGRPGVARGMCMAHYKRFRRNEPINDQPVLARRKYTAEERSAAVAEALAKGVRRTARRLGIAHGTIENWVRFARRGHR